MGGGKSVGLSAECVDLMLEFPGNRGYLCRHQLVDLRRSTLETFFRICPGPLIRKHWREDRIIEFWNGSELLYGSLGTSEDLDRIKSTEFGFFAIDEASETYEEYFLMLASRLRWVCRGGDRPRYHGLLASNPEPGWVKQRFVDQERPDHKFFPALPKDNPHLPEDYLPTLEANFPLEWVRRYIRGSWDVFEGQIYKEFDRKTHVIEGDFEPGVGWEHIRVIDHGYTNPTVCLWMAADQDGKLIVYDEHYEKQLTVDQHAHIIQTKHPGFTGITLIDPSCFATTQVAHGVPCSIADEYSHNGIIAISPYVKDGFVQEGVGINLVKKRLLHKSLLIHESCSNTIREIINLKWRQLKIAEKTGQNLPEVPVDRDNHTTDCLRYACVWKPHGSEVAVAPPGPGSFSHALKMHKRQHQQSEFVGWD